MNTWLMADWPAPPRVRAVVTTRQGGHSQGVFAGFNVGDHVGDAPETVAAHRTLLSQHWGIQPLWLTQVHGVQVAQWGQDAQGIEADAALSRMPGGACAIMTADCLPVLFCDRQGTVVAGAHAGWRGLHAGVLEATVAAMAVPAADILAWLGPAIGPSTFEVGAEVRAAFVGHDPQAASAFQAHGADKWLCDLYLLARQRLAALGVHSVYGGGLCTYQDHERFYSYRRDGQTGRIASLIWLDKAEMALEPSSSHLGAR